jgi:hypothetical protein
MRTVMTVAGALCCIVASLFVLSAYADNASGKDVPPKRYEDIGACPFECCSYRDWTVRESVQLLDRPNGQHVVGSLRKGEVVHGMTGEIISEPISVKANRDVPETHIKVGDTFYVLHYDGEGYWKVWFHGATELIRQSVINVPHPKAEWWVKVKSASGVVGWTVSGDRVEADRA